MFNIGNGGAAGIGVGGLGGVGVGISKKKVEPQFGVSFGLPYPSGGYPFNALYGGTPAQNPHFGSISPNGLNLGLVNVNPLLSFQFAKNEYGEKIFKPLVNLHVTPNENIITKVGNLFKAKKYGLLGGGGGGGGGYGSDYGSHNQHYHTHTHYGAAQYEPYYQSNYGSSQYEPYYQSNGGPSHYGSYPAGYGNEYYDGGYGGVGFRAGSSSSALPSGGYADASDTGPTYNYDPNAYYYSRSVNGSQVPPASQTYANNYANYDENGAGAFAPTNGAAVQNQGSQSVSFPSSRRKRSAIQTTDTFGKDIDSIAPKAKIIEKVMHSMREAQLCDIYCSF